jgi:hypothetical protein
VSVVNNEKAKVHGGGSDLKQQGGGNQQKWTWSWTEIEKV